MAGNRRPIHCPSLPLLHSREMNLFMYLLSPVHPSCISCIPPAFISGTLLYIFGGLFMYSLLPSSLLNFQIDFSCAISFMFLCYSSIAISNSTFDLSHQTAWAANSTKFLVEMCTLHIGNGCYEKNLTAVKLCNRG